MTKTLNGLERDLTRRLSMSLRHSHHMVSNFPALREDPATLSKRLKDIDGVKAVKNKDKRSYTMQCATSVEKAELKKIFAQDSKLKVIPKKGNKLTVRPAR